MENIYISFLWYLTEQGELEKFKVYHTNRVFLLEGETYLSRVPRPSVYMSSKDFFQNALGRKTHKVSTHSIHPYVLRLLTTKITKNNFLKQKKNDNYMKFHKNLIFAKVTVCFHCKKRQNSDMITILVQFTLYSV